MDSDTKAISQGPFCQGCNAWRGSLGLEPTPELYLEHMVEIFQEVRRVLREDGTIWCNLGDSYAANQVNNRNGYGPLATGHQKSTVSGPRKVTHGLKPKDLVGMPWRVAFALQDDGWYLRSDIIWAKPNPMPESVRDRPTKAHEYLFLLSKNQRYYFDQEAVRESWKPESVARDGRGYKGTFWARTRQANPSDNRSGGINGGEGDYSGRNLRSVWTIPTQPFPEAHFAVFPEALVEKPILAGSQRDGIVVDIFSGSGTTGVVAKRLGRKYIGIDLKAEYLDMSIKRINATPVPMALDV